MYPESRKPQNRIKSIYLCGQNLKEYKVFNIKENDKIKYKVVQKNTVIIFETLQELNCWIKEQYHTFLSDNTDELIDW